MDNILFLFPVKFQKELKHHIGKNWALLQEIRCRVNKPVELIFDNDIKWIDHYQVNRADVLYLLNHVSEHSIYRLEDELRDGYITIKGGHRIGIAGTVNTMNGHVKAINHVTFFNIRLSKAIKDSARDIVSHIYDKTYAHTLIIGPPLTGKTTIIRDLARLIGNGWNNIKPRKVGLIDERSEIAGCFNGIPQHDVGLRTDVLDACPKSEGMMMMIRSMSPNVILVDEIGSKDDAYAIMEAIYAGVKVICTAHAQSISEIKKRPNMKLLIDNDVFEKCIILSSKKRTGRVQYMTNGLNMKVR